MKYQIGKEYISDEIEQSQKPIRDIGYHISQEDDNFAYLHTFEKKEASRSLLIRIFTRKQFFDEQYKHKNNRVHNYGQPRRRDGESNTIHEVNTEDTVVTESSKV